MKTLKRFTLWLMIISIPSLLSAVPAYQGDVSFKQSDRTQFTGKLKGDEWFNWIEDKEGHVIIFNKKTKNYEYGMVKTINGVPALLPSGIKAGDAALKSRTFSTQIQTVDKETLMKIWAEKRKKALTPQK